jgi:N-acetyl-gamma-glutamyl-phosphate reductase
MTIKAGIIGATGYVGSELLRLLSHHPEVEIKTLSSQKHNGQVYHSVYENFSKICDLNCEENNLELLANQLDIIFLALPHGVTSKLITEKILKMVQIIDLSADFRLKSVETYQEWYENKHQNENLIRRAVFGLCEWKRREINEAKLIANPGCYPTCALLCLLPLVKEGIINTKGIIIDAKSGVSGAGRSLNLATHFTECNESIKAYKVMSHRHTPEIEQELSEINGSDINILFTPHLVPMNRGILCTCYGNLKEQFNFDEIKQVFEKYYSKENFIRLKKKGVLPETRWVKGSNYCDIGFTIDKKASKIIIIGAIDNLIKGAAGQAVQNMNIMFNLEETMGLKSIPMFPV